MNFNYKVPPHLIGYLSTMPEAKIQETITRALEMSSSNATSQGSGDDSNVMDEMYQMLLSNHRKSSVEMKHILNLISDIKEQLNNGVEIGRSNNAPVIDEKKGNIIERAKNLADEWFTGGAEDLDEDDEMELAFLNNVVK